MGFELLAIGEVKPDFISGRIQTAIKANYSHIAILVDDETIYHAIGKGFCKTTLDELLKEGPCVVRRRVYIPVKKTCCAKTWLEARQGTKYSVVQYIGFIFPFLRFLPFINNGKRETVCSEVAADFVSECSTLNDIAAKAYGDCDWINPKECMDIAYGIYGGDND